VATTTASTHTDRIRPLQQRRGDGLVRPANVGDAERWASLLGGGTLALYGLSRGSPGGLVLALLGGSLAYRGATGHCHLYQALGLSTADDRGRRDAGAPADAAEVERSISIGKPADDLYRSWREPRNLSRIMGHFAEVTPLDGSRAHWAVRGPMGRRIEWDSRVVDDRPGEVLRWESLPAADLPNEGSIRFRPAPGDRGTEVTLRVDFDPPGGALGRAAMRLLGVAPMLIAEKALRRFKSLVETGEIPTTSHQPAARADTE
jgi:uncharacterized membrane protein